MNPFRDFSADVEWVLQTCEKQVSAYPPSLRRFDRVRPKERELFKGDNARKSIVYLLPFWLKDAFDLDQDTCRLIAQAHIFAAFYFLTQDQVMDAGPEEYKGHLLPQGTLFFLDAMAPYRSLFDSDSPFWTFLEKYISELAESVCWEREQHWGQAKEYKKGDLLRLARKAAPLKTPCAAMSLLAGRQEDIGPLEKMVDHVLVALQLMDDLRDWREDLARGNYTYFLTRVMVAQGIPLSSSLTETDVRKALVAGSVLEEVLGLAIEYSQRALESILALHVPYLKKYIAFLDQDYCQLVEDIRAERTRWIQEQLAFLVQH
jgi:hypothetical protein